MKIVSFSDDVKKIWDEFVDNSINGTFLHTRKYINYHGDKYKDNSVLIYKKEKLIGLIPAAEDPQNKNNVVSHPGITYGGLIQKGKIKGEENIILFETLKNFYKKKGFKSFIYKVIPSFYNLIPNEDDIYSLFRLKARIIKCDLSSTINLNKNFVQSKRRKRSLRNAYLNNLEIASGEKFINSFWEVLSENLLTKYGVKPVHTIEEIKFLLSLFPNNIECIVCLHQKQLIAGVLLFKNKNVIHTQYISSNDQGKSLNALDFIFDHLINRSKLENLDWFNFGISTENNGLNLNNSLYKFKSEFGAGSSVYYTYHLNL